MTKLEYKLVLDFAKAEEQHGKLDIRSQRLIRIDMLLISAIKNGWNPAILRHEKYYESVTVSETVKLGPTIDLSKPEVVE